MRRRELCSRKGYLYWGLLFIVFGAIIRLQVKGGMLMKTAPCQFQGDEA